MEHYFTKNSNLKSAETKITFKIENETIEFIVDNGVFSKRGIDYGTKLLLQNLIKENINGSLLDIGCGYGPIGITLAKIKRLNVTMSDVNDRALALATKNSQLNKVKTTILESDIYNNIHNTYDIIATNPPIRAGKKVVYDIIMNARNHLNKQGQLYLVIRKQQGAKSLLKDMDKYYQTTIIDKDGGYFIIKAQVK